ncbi:MAG: MBL fold metallo-hydrolase [Bacilli bacterium]
MEIKTVVVGTLQTNCYIISNAYECLIIDPGASKNKIIDAIGSLKPIGIIITHNHYDHIGALDEIKNKYDIPIYDITNLQEKSYNVNGFMFDVIYTLGHASTCITIYFKKEKVMFVGDFLFKDSIGRTDLETSNEEEMMMSLLKIKKYDDDITIYPGHGEKTNLGYEKINNYFLK